MATKEDVIEAVENLDSLIADLKQLRHFLDTEGQLLPSVPWISPYETYNVWLTSSESYRDEDGNWKSKIDEDKTKQNIKEFLAAVGNCEKEYSGPTLTIQKKFGKVTLEGNVNREVVCTKRVVKREFVEHKEPGYWREDYEWDCNEPSLLGYVKS
jgi:hypothetical protein